MSYQVLARKWRPQTFEDLIGQEFAALTLKNSIQSGKIAHALIFAGPRGVGKTSTARIVAKAINCRKKDSGAYPCKTDHCTHCKEISESRSLDVHEIDAASHTGVNDIREIIENVKYMPNSAQKKVYIIDEVHMLSQSAFNALLKTLEEPPDHVLFILATTEIQKIPPTILSRCQRYDFKKVSTEKIKETLIGITEKENIKIDGKTLSLIARESDGSLRDSLSLLDQLVATFKSDIDYESVTRILGILDKETLRQLVLSIIEKNPKNCIELLHNADNKGISPKRLIHELTQTFRDLVFLKICGADFVSELSEDEKKDFLEIIKNESIETLELILNILIESGEKIQRSFYPNIALELTLIKLSTVERVININEILEKLNSISDNPERQNEDHPAKKKSQPLTKDSLNSDFDKEEFTNLVREKNKFISMRLENSESIEINDSTIKVRFPAKDINYEYFNKRQNLDNFRQLAKEILLKEELSIEFTATNEVEKEINGFDLKNEKKKDDPVLDDAVRIFDGRILKSKLKSKES
ncbi:MAG: DNA polymerase III subunit gamma/tau [Thermodesulfobacteriota bacterium]